MTKIFTKFATVLASLALVLSMVPANAFADEGLLPSDPGTPTIVADPAPVEPAADPAPVEPAADPAPAEAPAEPSAALAPEVLEVAPLIASTEATVTNQAEFDAAMANPTITSIIIANDFTVTSTLNITRSVTVNGGDHTISVTDAVTGSAVLITGSGVTVNHLVVDSAGKIAKGSGGIQGIQAYVASNVILDHVTSKNAGKSGIIANGSTVTVINVTTSGNTWHGINVDQGSGVTSPAILTISGTSSHTESTLFNPAIYVDNTAKGSVTGDTDQYLITHPFGPTTTEYNLDPNYHTPPSCNGSTFDGFTLGSVNNQGGWKSLGAYDQAVVNNTYGFSTFGCKSLRISNAVTSGSFGDQTFSPSTANEAGETSAENGEMSGGTRQNHFDAQFDLGTALPTFQSGLSMSVSPDRGDGARMSYLRFEDHSPSELTSTVDAGPALAEGIHVFFDDVQGTVATGVDGCTSVACGNFVETDIATLDRTVPHTIKFSIDFVDGPSNDVVTISIDGVVVHTGTTWEDYFRFDPESNPELADTSRTVDSLLFRVGGSAAPANSGKGYVIDNVDISTSMTPVTVVDTGGSSNGNRRNGSGGGSSSSTGNSGTSGGSVLGAATFNFTRDLYFGLRGDDVKELQTELIAAGYSIPAGPTGYFGPQTRAAVAQWQAEHGITPAAGYFGPISRAKYNADGGFHLLTTPVTTGS